MPSQNPPSNEMLKNQEKQRNRSGLNNWLQFWNTQILNSTAYLKKNRSHVELSLLIVCIGVDSHFLKKKFERKPLILEPFLYLLKPKHKQSNTTWQIEEFLWLTAYWGGLKIQNSCQNLDFLRQPRRIQPTCKRKGAGIFGQTLDCWLYFEEVINSNLRYDILLYPA